MTPADEHMALSAELETLRAEVIELRDVMLLQEVGVYRYAHPLEDAAAYQDALKSLEADLKHVIKGGRAATGTKKWAINGSEREGARMIADIAKLMLRAYNSEAEAVLRSLRPYKLDAAKQRLNKMRDSISKLGKSMQLQISDEFHSLRIKELELTADFLQKQEEEREQERERRIQLREQELAERELQRESERLEKERAHYVTALNTLDARGDAEGSEPVNVDETPARCI